MRNKATEMQIKTYARRLKNLRIKRGYTLSSLAVLVNSNKQTLSYIENRHYKSIDLTLLEALAKNLDCTTDYLLGSSGTPHKTAEKNGMTYIIPIRYETTATPIKNRLYELCGDNIGLLAKIVTFLDDAPVKYKKAFEICLDTFIDLIKK